MLAYAQTLALVGDHPPGWQSCRVYKAPVDTEPTVHCQSTGLSGPRTEYGRSEDTSPRGEVERNEEPAIFLGTGGALNGWREK
jgi:hypothetical protein